jgi:hypothetical protein
MSICTCCGENVDFVNEQTCDSCEEIMCDDCYLTHDGICDACNTDDSNTDIDIDNISNEDYNNNLEDQ